MRRRERETSRYEANEEMQKSKNEREMEKAKGKKWKVERMKEMQFQHNSYNRSNMSLRHKPLMLNRILKDSERRPTKKAKAVQRNYIRRQVKYALINWLRKSLQDI